MKWIYSAPWLTIVLLISAIAPVRAQSMTSCAATAIASDNPVANITAAGRAKNLARQTAESANGGLGKYHAEASMHGPIGQAPCTDNGDGSLSFTFQGTAPGSDIPIAESVVTVNTQTWKITLDKNTRLVGSK